MKQLKNILKIKVSKKILIRPRLTQVSINHIDNKFIKKKLSERWNIFDEFKIQRDLYNSFIIMNVEDNLEKIDSEMCSKEFESFKVLHDKEIIRIKSINNKLISSM